MVCFIRTSIATASYATCISTFIYWEVIAHHGLGTFQMVRALGVGILHGLAGSAAVALLMMSTIHDPLWSAIYLGVFGLGTVAGMMVISIGMAVPATLSVIQWTRLERWMVLGSGALSVGFGLFIVWQIGFGEGLF